MIRRQARTLNQGGTMNNERMQLVHHTHDYGRYWRAAVEDLASGAVYYVADGWSFPVRSTDWKSVRQTACLACDHRCAHVQCVLDKVPTLPTLD
jgi:hypothetical protein